MRYVVNQRVIQSFDDLDSYSNMITKAHQKRFGVTDFSTVEYIVKMLEELGEVQRALQRNNRDNAIEETLDFIFTGFMMLNHLEVTKKELRKMVDYVVTKQEVRVLSELPKSIQKEIKV